MPIDLTQQCKLRDRRTCLSQEDRPCRARPADRSLAAEDRSATGVRDLTGPDPTPSRTAVELGHIGATAEGSAADNHGH